MRGVSPWHLVSLFYHLIVIIFTTITIRISVTVIIDDFLLRTPDLVFVAFSFWCLSSFSATNNFFIIWSALALTLWFWFSLWLRNSSPITMYNINWSYKPRKDIENIYIHNCMISIIIMTEVVMMKVMTMMVRIRMVKRMWMRRMRMMMRMRIEARLSGRGARCCGNWWRSEKPL